MGDAGSEDDVLAPRSLLREVIADGCCPLHLRLRILRLLQASPHDSPIDRWVPAALSDAYCANSTCVERIAALPQGGDAALSVAVDTDVSLDNFAALNNCCLAAVSSFLPLSDVLEVRACGQEPLQWAMEHHDGIAETEADGNVPPQRVVHDRIRTRLWMRRIQDITSGTKDESIFETRIRNLADTALRSRMETEMQDALQHMEEQIQRFQAEVDQRLEEQERHVRRMVEERVQRELDSILHSEIAKMQIMVEERVRERVAATFQREVRETVRDLRTRLDSLVDENELLRDAFAEANLRAKCLFWAHSSPLMQSTATATACLGAAASRILLFSLKRRVAVAASWHPGLVRSTSQVERV